MKDDEPIFVGIERARSQKLSYSKALDTFQELQNFQKKIDCPDYDEMMQKTRIQLDKFKQTYDEIKIFIVQTDLQKLNRRS